MEKKMDIIQQQAAIRDAKIAELKAQGMSKDKILKELKIRPRRTTRKSHA